MLERVAAPETHALARRTIDAVPGMAEAITEDDLRQLLHGFCQMLEEAMAQSSQTTRQFFLETAIPALVASGQGSSTLVHSIGIFAVLLTGAALEELEADDRQAATEWLATFFGDYLQDVLAAAVDAEADRDA